MDDASFAALLNNHRGVELSQLHHVFREILHICRLE